MRWKLIRDRVRGLEWFFFQAEDGIRDLTVTGVQTCALPISPGPAQSGRNGAATDAGRAHRRATAAVRARQRPAGAGPGARQPAESAVGAGEIGRASCRERV